ncbi:adrenocortical dysplasia protein homolog isoform X2 [Callorhinchus milii]|uniref:adrenocortical dysplasia protein homolog isoform X2 n=1 Tax=Callorhinchus milii TaxID=7868 RepID=UPI001C3F82B3|nr:adrenocortical dysplasia protein homolog isoform X2 [Callorhinchus milii]
MSAHRPTIGQPWIAELLRSHGAALSHQKPVPAQVIQFIPPEKWQKEAEFDPAAVVHLSDLKYTIKAVVTKGAKQELEQEEDDYTFDDIKEKMVILKQFDVHLRVEPELKECEFYLVVEKFKILPAENIRSDVRSCNLDPAVQKRLKEAWENHVKNTTFTEGSCSGISLTNLIDAAMGEEVNSLKDALILCLDASDSSEPSTSTAVFLPSGSQMTGWEALRRKDKKQGNAFTVPETELIISSDQQEILNNLKEWKDDYVYDKDKTSTESAMENSCADTLSHDKKVDAKEKPEAATSSDPWVSVSHLGVNVKSSGASVLHKTTSEPGRNHVDEDNCGSLSTISQAPSSSGPAIAFQMPDSSTRHDLDKSADLYTEESQGEQSHLELLGTESLLRTHVISADDGRQQTTNIAEPEDNRKNNNRIKAKYNLSKNSISPLQLAAASSSSSTTRLAPTSPIGAGQSRPGATVHETEEARNCVPEAKKRGLSDSEDEESYEILRAVKRKQKDLDSDDELDSCEEDGQAFCQQARAGEYKENWNSSSDETLIEKDDSEEQGNDNCRVSTTSQLGQSSKKQCRWNKLNSPSVFKENGWKNAPETREKMVFASNSSSDIDMVKPTPQPRRRRGVAASGVRPTKTLCSDRQRLPVSHTERGPASHAEHSKDPPLQRHADGSRFQYRYPPPTPEIIAQVNSLRLSPGLLKWAISYLTQPSSTQD